MNQSRRRRAFTLIELLVVLAVIVVVAVIGLPQLARRHARSSKIGCVNNLKQIGLAFWIFSNEHQDRYPISFYTDEALLPPPASRPTFLYGAMSGELSTPKILLCPQDTRRWSSNWSALTSSNISYFMGNEAYKTQSRSWLTGDRNLTTNGVAVRPGLLRFTTPMNLGWTAEMHNRCGNVVLGDGSVQQWTSARLQSMVAEQVAATNELWVP